MKIRPLLLSSFLGLVMVFVILSGFQIYLSRKPVENFNQVVEITAPDLVALGMIESSFFRIYSEMSNLVSLPGGAEEFREAERAELDEAIEQVDRYLAIYAENGFKVNDENEQAFARRLYGIRGGRSRCGKKY